MIEYLYDCIRATAGQDICICAVITDDAGDPITSGCSLMLHDNEDMLVKINGVYDGEAWSFDVPAEDTKELKGRYWYCICKDNTNLCFKTPIYFK